MTQPMPRRTSAPAASAAASVGGFAMVALDQRVSLRNMFVDAGLGPTGAALDAFRTGVATALPQEASAMLLERGYVSAAPRPTPWSGTSALIMAADRLVQAPGQPAEDSKLDRDAALAASEEGAVALKLLAVWISGERNVERISQVHEFVDLARELGLIAIVECLPHRGAWATSPLTGAREFLRATSALCARADIFKAQMPTQSGAAPAAVERLGQDVTAVVPCPWVVLSTGVPPDRFHELPGAACRAGASGFLAGRAIWGPAVGAGDRARYLVEQAKPRLAELAAIVDREARPWSEAVGSDLSSGANST